MEIWSSLQGKLQADEHDQGASSIDQPWKYVGVRKRRQKRTRIRTCGKGALKAFHCPATSKKGKVDKVGSFIQPLQREPVFFKPLRELACQGGEKGGQAELSSTLGKVLTISNLSLTYFVSIPAAVTWTRPRRNRSDQLFLIRETWRQQCSWQR